ncbi:MAG: DUF4130 domain-containing protein [Faecalibacterium sp.]
MISCLCSFTVPSSPSAELPINKKRTRTLFRKESGSSTNCLVELAAPLELPPPSEREQQFQALWKQFYQTLEIKARHNEKCRMTHCPKRFWADMVEMKDEF